MLDTPEAANKREEQFLAEVRETGVVWCLRLGEGWFNWSDDLGHARPVWSHPDGARGCARATCPEYELELMDLDTFVDHYLPQLADQDIWVAVSPTEDLCGNQRPAGELARSLRRDDAYRAAGDGL